MRRIWLACLFSMVSPAYGQEPTVEARLHEAKATIAQIVAPKPAWTPAGYCPFETPEEGLALFLSLQIAPMGLRPEKIAVSCEEREAWRKGMRAEGVESAMLVMARPIVQDTHSIDQQLAIAQETLSQQALQALKLAFPENTDLGNLPALVESQDGTKALHRYLELRQQHLPAATSSLIFPIASSKNVQVIMENPDQQRFFMTGFSWEGQLGAALVIDASWPTPGEEQASFTLLQELLDHHQALQ